MSLVLVAACVCFVFAGAFLMAAAADFGMQLDHEQKRAAMLPQLDKINAGLSARITSMEKES